MAGKNLPKSAAVMAAIQQRARAGETVYQFARDTGLSTRTVKFILAQPATAPKPEQPDPPQIAEPPVYDYNEPTPHVERRHVNGMAEKVGGVTINPWLPQHQPVFRTTFRQPSAGTPERTPTTPAPDRGWDIWTGKPF